MVFLSNVGNWSVFLNPTLFPLSRGGSARLLDVVEAETPVGCVRRVLVALELVRVHRDDERFHETCRDITFILMQQLSYFLCNIINFTIFYVGVVKFLSRYWGDIR